MRTIIDLPDDNVARLDDLARAQGRSRAHVVREAVSQYLGEHEHDGYLRVLNEAFGAWDGKFTEDAVAFQQRMRAEWDRDWG